MLYPVTLIPVPCKMLQAGDIDSNSEDNNVDDIPRSQFHIADCTLTILSVFNVDRSSNNDKKC